VISVSKTNLFVSGLSVQSKLTLRKQCSPLIDTQDVSVLPVHCCGCWMFWWLIWCLVHDVMASGNPSFEWHKLVNVWFIDIKISYWASDNAGWSAARTIRNMYLPADSLDPAAFKLKTALSYLQLFGHNTLASQTTDRDRRQTHDILWLKTTPPLFEPLDQGDPLRISPSIKLTS